MSIFRLLSFTWLMLFLALIRVQVLLSLRSYDEYLQELQANGSDQLLFQQSQCSLEYQIIDLNDEKGNMIVDESNKLHYYPRCIKVTRCIGCCSNRGSNLDDLELYECLPTSIIYKSVVQVAQSINRFGMNNVPWNIPSIYNNNLIKLYRRKVKVAFHTGCQCRCRHNPFGQCQYAERKIFFNDTCRCECRSEVIARDQPTCSTIQTVHGRMFWDDNRCQCRCPQYYYSYTHRIIPEPEPYCPQGYRFNEERCTCLKV